MATAGTASIPVLSIDVTKDLESISDLNNLLTSQQGAIFALGAEIAKFAGQEIQTAVGASGKISLTAPANWTTKNGISFSLTPTANCSISIGNTSATFPIAMNIDSPATTDVVIGPAPGSIYINIDLDFDIKGSVSGGGTFSGIGVAGKASGSESATLSFCQPVDATLEAIDAFKTALSALVLPLAPDCALRMTPGSMAKVNFDGALDFEVDLTYGLGSYQVSAPNMALVQQSLEKAWEKLTPPSLDINAGAKASVSYTHADHFGLLVSKSTPNTATLYLVRSASNETDESVGISVGITSTNVSLTLDPSQVSKTVQQVTGSSSVASAVGSAVAQPVNSLQTSLTSKLNNWISDVTGQAGLTFTLSQQSGRTALFTFAVNLAAAQLAQQSWDALLQGSVTKALQIGGLTLLPGSGVSDQLKRSSTIQLQFFNLFQWSDTDDYFSTAYTELAPDGTIRVFRDVGQEQQIKTKLALASMRIHLVASATEDTKGDPSNAEVDLYIELSESGDPKAANVLAGVVAMIPATQTLKTAENAISGYLQANSNGTLNVISILKPSAFQNISCSPYNGSTPPPLPQKRDSDNWNAFQAATEALMPSLSFVPPWTYGDWMNFNSIANTGSAGAVPNRRNSGNPNAVPPSFFAKFPSARQQEIYYFLASAGFMNLCDDLNFLSGASQTSTPDQWNDLLQFLTNVITNDVYIDYAKPTAGALLSLCVTGGSHVASADIAQAKDASSLTCTLTLA